MTQLYTGIYQLVTADHGALVRSTVGFPRFPLKYQLAGHWKDVTPERPWLSMSQADYRELYMAKLDRIGLDNLMDMAELYAQHDPAGRGRVVVLCFDRLEKPGVWCHREMFGEWMTDHGVPVIELFPRPAPVAPVPPDATLF